MAHSSAFDTTWRVGARLIWGFEVEAVHASLPVPVRKRTACWPYNVRVERAAASLTLIEAALSKSSRSLSSQRSYRPRARSNALLDDPHMIRAASGHPEQQTSHDICCDVSAEN